MTFNQIDACAKLVQTLARMELPSERDDEDAIEDDTNKFYRLIEEARYILKQSRAD